MTQTFDDVIVCIRDNDRKHQIDTRIGNGILLYKSSHSETYLNTLKQYENYTKLKINHPILENDFVALIHVINPGFQYEFEVIYSKYKLESQIQDRDGRFNLRIRDIIQYKCITFSLVNNDANYYMECMNYNHGFGKAMKCHERP